MNRHIYSEYIPEGENFVSKGWGYEEWIVNNDKYCGKKLHVAKGRKCSLHYHPIKEETFYIISGEISLEIHKGYITMTVNLKKGDSFHIPPGTKHRFTGVRASIIFEISTTHSDEDVIRIELGDQ